MRLWLILMLSTGLLLGACAPSAEADDPKTLHFVTTTGMLGDAVQAIAGDAATVTALMGPGVDPHYYKATQGDVGRLRGADLVVHNGLHLEGRMQEVLDILGRDKPVLALADGLPEDKLRRVGDAGNAMIYDPHLWFDVPLWSTGISYLAEAMGEAFPEHASTFAANAQRYKASLEDLDVRLREAYATVPGPNRVLVTSHDAFSYFGRAYGFTVMGLQGVSTVSEFGLRDLSDLVDTLTTRRIPAVFVESSVSPRAIQSVVEGCQQKGLDLRIGGELYSDAMGDEGTPDGTYIGMLEHNARLIVAGLGGSWPSAEGQTQAQVENTTREPASTKPAQP